jgi:acetyltransferase-like isoleucine patch superfamily enzyme
MSESPSAVPRQEHVDVKGRLAGAARANPLEWIQIILAAWNTLKCRYVLRCIGKGTVVGRGTKIVNFTNITIGSGCFIQEYVYMRAGRQGYIRIANDCAMNSFAKLFGHGGIEIGERTQLGPGCLITTTEHDYQRTDLKTEFRKVTIGKGVWVGANSLILPGVTIGDDCVVGAGSVVTRDIPSGSIAVGNPARVIKSKSDGQRNS